jgi:hypothetical protein
VASQIDIRKNLINVFTNLQISRLGIENFESPHFHCQKEAQ